MPSPKKKTTRKPRATRSQPKAAPAAPVQDAVQPPAEAAQAAQAEAPVVEQAPAVEEPSGPDADGEAQPAGPVIVELGGVSGRLELRATGDVQSLLSDELKARVDVLREHPSTLELLQRVRATEGRCAPIFFTETEVAPMGEPGEPQGALSIKSYALFAGCETLAAALNLCMDSIAVVTIASEDAGALQSYIAQAMSNPADTEDDDLYIRVLAHYSD